MLSVDRAGLIIEANDNFCATARARRGDMIGIPVRDLLATEDWVGQLRDLLSTLARDDIWRGEVHFAFADRREMWCDLTVAAERSEDGALASFTLLGLNITQRKRAELVALAERRRREDMEGLLHDIVETVPNGIVAFDETGKVIFFNEAHRDLYSGLDAGLHLGPDQSDPADELDMFPLPTGEPAPIHAERSYGEGGGLRSFVQKLPGDRWIQVQNRQSATGRLISVQTDVTSLKRAEKHIKHQASRDPLTGLSNRIELFGQLARITAGDGDENESCALLLVDLDDFKGINDSYGHDAGDEVLRQLARNLNSAIRRSDIFARLGGDEFAIILPGQESADQIVPTLEKLKRAAAQPITIGNRTVMPSASIGVACFPRDGSSPKQLMKCADHALYQSKQNGRGGYSLYDASMRRQVARRAYLSEKLRATLERNEIGVALQPQRDMTTGLHSGFEALVRWKVKGGAIPPVEIISIAEEAGLVKQLSYQMIEKTLGIVARLKERGLSPGVVAFNTVASQLYDPEFPVVLSRLLDRHGMRPSEVELEVTENVILDRSAEVIAKAIQNLHAMGFGIALDDFGTGYASLTHLKRFPLTRLKIDRSFIGGIENGRDLVVANKDDFIISRTIVSLAHSLDLKVVAEGIETVDQYNKLMNMGCDIAQGYLVGVPMNEDQVWEYMTIIERDFLA